MRKWIIILSVSVCFHESFSLPEIYIRNYQEKRRELGFDKYDPTRIEEVGIAVLDAGFGSPNEDESFEDYVKNFLPKEATRIITHYGPGSFCTDEVTIAETPTKDQLATIDSVNRSTLNPEINHGLKMAQLVYALLNLNSKGPHFYLLNAHGPRNFIKACACLEKLAIRLGTPAMDNVKRLVVLHSQNFESGNFDGKQYLNKYIDPVLDANPLRPVIWVNAAGNYHRQVINARVNWDEKGWVLFKDKNFVGLKSNAAQTPIRIELSWNSFGPKQTTKDLDLYLVDENNNVTKIINKQNEDKSITRWAGQFKQTDKDEKELALDETNLPREFIELKLKENSPGKVYRIYVHVKNPERFDNAFDKLRVVVTGPRDIFYNEATKKLEEPIELIPNSEGGEIFTPGDHPRVITVGDRSPMSSIGPTSDGRIKPDFLVENNHFFFNDNTDIDLSSSAAAVVAAHIVAMLGVNPTLKAQQIIEMQRARSPFVRMDFPYGVKVKKISLSTARRMSPKVFAYLTTLYSIEELDTWKIESSTSPSRLVIGVAGEFPRINSPNLVSGYFIEDSGNEGMKVYPRFSQNSNVDFHPLDLQNNRGKSASQFVYVRKQESLDDKKIFIWQPLDRDSILKLGLITE